MTSGLSEKIARAVSDYWSVRHAQKGKGKGKDTGDRSAVTGGAQMDGFIQLLGDLAAEAGALTESIFFKKAVELPGFFRPTKEWDLIVVRDGQLVLALEAKSQAGPSFGNNFNNRIEEAMGSALDLWTAYEKGAFNKTVKPWLGYIFLLEDCPESRRKVGIREPHFEVFPEFKEASYADRYELFCRKIVRQRHYSSAAFLMSDREGGKTGKYTEPADDLKFETFARSMMSHIAVYGRGG